MLELRLLEDTDFNLVEKWLNKEHVKRWYEIPRLGITIDNWMSEIKEYREKYSWITYFIVLLDDYPIGFCLYYRCIDSNEEYGSLPIDGSYGIDYFIGEEAYVGKGLGKQMVTMLTNKVFSILDAQIVTADIDPNNNASKQTLLACGFTLVDEGGSRYMIKKQILSDHALYLQGDIF